MAGSLKINFVNPAVYKMKKMSLLNLIVSCDLPNLI
jgi:hypothetical protein